MKFKTVNQYYHLYNETKLDLIEIWFKVVKVLLELLLEPHCCVVIVAPNSILIRIMNELEKSFKTELIDYLIIYSTNPRSAQSKFWNKSYSSFTENAQEPNAVNEDR